MNSVETHYSRAKLLAHISPFMALFLLLSLTLFSHSTAYAAATASGPGQTLNVSVSKGTLTQSSAFLQAKNAHRIGRGGVITNVSPLAYPSSASLNTSLATGIVEPLAYGYDNTPKYYTDYYNWYLCGPGAATVALKYWSKVPWKSSGKYSDPYLTSQKETLYWNSYNRAEIMYLASTVNVPNSGWTSPGMMTYSAYSNYSNSGTAFSDLAIGLNYEASGESSSWKNYFYSVVGHSSLSQASLLGYVETDIYTDGVPLIVSVNDGYLPDWPQRGSNGSSHFVAILGYDNGTGTYTYAETCASGAAGCGTSGVGIYNISQSTLWTAIANDYHNGYDDGGIVW